MRNRSTLYRSQRRWTRWLLVLGVWTFIAVVFAALRYVAFLETNRLMEKPNPFPGWSVFFVFPLIALYMWAVMTPLIAPFARRFPIPGKQWARNLLIHIPVGILFMSAHMSVWSTLYWCFGPVRIERYGSLGGYLRSNMINGVGQQLTFYIPLLIVIYAFDYYRKYREGELKASELRAQLAQAKLQALKMQLHPHFLFNTLNAISELIYRNAETAEVMITNLSDLLRITLNKEGNQEVTLKQELEFLSKYLEIEKTRFQERLRVEFRIDPKTLDARVPDLILQPIVENAVRHGIAPLARGGSIEIAAHRENGTLYLSVRDDGRGLPREWQAIPKEGVGIANTRARLLQLYGANHRFELNSRPQSHGLIVTMAIPFTESETETNGEDSSLHRRRRTVGAGESEKVSP
ncbi:MAG: histidine kinase [Pyrinomonadaceae bacterium]|nr:histidine kinase [Pyrinomonadaceae bacterium]